MSLEAEQRKVAAVEHPGAGDPALQRPPQQPAVSVEAAGPAPGGRPEPGAGPLGGVHMPCDALYAALPDPRSVAVQAPGDVAAAEAARKMTAFVATKVARQGPDSKAPDCKSFHR